MPHGCPWISKEKITSWFFPFGRAALEVVSLLWPSFFSLFFFPETGTSESNCMAGISFGSGDVEGDGGGGSGRSGCGSGIMNYGDYGLSRASAGRGGQGQLESEMLC